MNNQVDERINSKHFAVVVLTYNHPEITSKCLASVALQSAMAEVFVVHNGSEEKNSKLIQKNYPQLTHLFLSENRGYTGGANFGLREAFKKYEQVLFLTNDTELIQLPQNIPPYFSSVTIQKRNTHLIDSILGFVDLKKGHLKHLKEESDLTQLPTQNFYIPGTAFWMDQQTFEKLNGFDETFHTYWDDVDLSYRATLQNITLNYSKDTVVKHKIGKTCHKNAFYTYYLFQRNRKKFILKHNLQSFSFWARFLFDITKYCKYRFNYLWRIIYE